MNISLEADFTTHLRDSIQECRKLGYSPTEFERMLNTWGGLAAAKRLLVPSTKEGQTGFQRVMKLNRRELTVEYAVLLDRFRDLFSPEELKLAQWRLDNPQWAEGL
ncbi:TPA: hypothetical protein NL046_006090 [Pseudomonas aeruginosa]|uniref:hypothetical protein n=1 Tax=Pseudomonas TaxID=286 RepID=UPI000FECE842|nr:MULTISPECIES: hypothetical protein [Pseudomonas]EJB8515019.1 hypothetical protein [Pseudomonas aeruginosa]ELL0592098.1 hypothetical protein [Pseudomonas aeruginosa]EME5360673.1 hypothetical protein [Pseudomonas aeruginosa]MBG5377390.1 hypothetical protein [Pseudomonas aeruginosa]MBG5823740.1 hypothetical protein [Pseudomonas aeruginosa]